MRVIYYIRDFCYSCDMRNQSPSVLCVSSIRLRCGEIKEISVCERSAHSTEQLKVVNPTGMDCQETDFVCRVFGCAADNCYTGIPVALVRSLAGWLSLSLGLCVCARACECLCGVYTVHAGRSGATEQRTAENERIEERRIQEVLERAELKWERWRAVTGGMICSVGGRERGLIWWERKIGSCGNVDAMSVGTIEVFVLWIFAGSKLRWKNVIDIGL